MNNLQTALNSVTESVKKQSTEPLTTFSTQTILAMQNALAQSQLEKYDIDVIDLDTSAKLPQLEADLAKCTQCKSFDECHYKGTSNEGMRPAIKVIERQPGVRELITGRTVCTYRKAYDLQHRQHRAFDLSNVPVRYRNLEVKEATKRYLQTEEQLQILMQFFKFETYHLHLSGPHGTGKTALASAIANLHLAANSTVAYSTAAEVFTNLRYTSNDEYYAKLNQYLDAHLLIIEDIPEEISAYNREQLDMLIDRRQRDQIPLITSTRERLKDRDDLPLLQRSVELKLKWSD